MANKTPVTLAVDGKSHEPLGVTDTIAAAAILINPAADNLTTAPPSGLYTKVAVGSTTTLTMSGAGTPASPITADVKIAPAVTNILSSAGGAGLRVEQYIEPSNTLTITGYGTLASKTSYEVKRNPVASNILTSSAAGLNATIVTTSSGTAVVEGSGTVANPIKAGVRVSDKEYNRLEEQTDGLYINPIICNPQLTLSSSPGPAATIKPQFNLGYSIEHVFLAGNNTTFTLDFSDAPADIANRFGYRVRVVMLTTAGTTNYLKFKTAAGSIKTPQGVSVVTASYAYPFQINSSNMSSIDIVVNAGLGWCIEEATPATSPISVFKKTAAVGSGAIVSTVDMSSLPFHLYGYDWALRTSMICLPTTTHTRSLTVSLGSTVLYKGDVSFVADTPFIPPSATSVYAPVIVGSVVTLPSMTMSFGAGAGNIAVNAKIICERLIRGSVPLDTA